PLSFCFVLIMRRPLPMSTCFPYTTLFRSLGGMVFLIVHSSLYQDAWKIVSVSIYGSALFLLYLVSTLYHTISPGKWKDRFQVLEDRKSTRLNSSHVSISYAVFCLKKKKNI